MAQVLNRLACNPDADEPGAGSWVELERQSIDRPQGLVKFLATNGHTVEVKDARYFIHFGNLIYQGRDVPTPFRLDTEIRVPGTERSLLVPVGHSQHEIRVRGPVVNADLSVYFGIAGRAEFRPTDTRDQAWVLGASPTPVTTTMPWRWSGWPARS